MIFIWFIYAAWLLLIVYLTVKSIGVKRDTEPHLLQSFGLMFAMIVAFLVTFIVRSFALAFGWSLPVFRTASQREAVKRPRH